MTCLVDQQAELILEVVCVCQAFTESVNIMLPLTVELPEELKKTDVLCLQ
jgi:hypothetical protein